jgi:hypothetical protein
MNTNLEELQLVPGNSLLTPTPEAGRHLAIKMARLIIKATQPDDSKRKEVREQYAGNPLMLIEISKVVATEFATIAAANKYWKKKKPVKAK